MIEGSSPESGPSRPGSAAAASESAAAAPGSPASPESARLPPGAWPSLPGVAASPGRRRITGERRHHRGAPPRPGVPHHRGVPLKRPTRSSARTWAWPTIHARTSCSRPPLIDATAGRVGKGSRSAIRPPCASAGNTLPADATWPRQLRQLRWFRPPRRRGWSSSPEVSRRRLPLSRRRSPMWAAGPNGGAHRADDAGLSSAPSSSSWLRSPSRSSRPGSWAWADSCPPVHPVPPIQAPPSDRPARPPARPVRA